MVRARARDSGVPAAVDDAEAVAANVAAGGRREALRLTRPGGNLTSGLNKTDQNMTNQNKK